MQLPVRKRPTSPGETGQTEGSEKCHLGVVEALGKGKGRTELPHSSNGRTKGGIDLHEGSDPGWQLGQDGAGCVTGQEHYAGRIPSVPDGPAFVGTEAQALSHSCLPNSTFPCHLPALPQPQVGDRAGSPPFLFSPSPTPVCPPSRRQPGLPMDRLAAFMRMLPTSTFLGGPGLGL